MSHITFWSLWHLLRACAAQHQLLLFGSLRINSCIISIMLTCKLLGFHCKSLWCSRHCLVCFQLRKKKNRMPSFIHSVPTVFFFPISDDFLSRQDGVIKDENSTLFFPEQWTWQDCLWLNLCQSQSNSGAPLYSSIIPADIVKRDSDTRKEGSLRLGSLLY